MMGRIKRLNQHPEAMMLMVQGRIFVPFTIIKTHYTSRTMYRHNIRFYMASIFITKIVDFKFSIYYTDVYKME